jgi:signal transduction histidine kinase
MNNNLEMELASPTLSNQISNSKPTILVVDDISDNLVLMINLLKDTYQVIVANSGAKALRIATSDFPPDLILLDIMMPKMDGHEVCIQLKLNPKTINIPVIFLTAKTDVADEKKGLDLGAVDYITKPISPPIMLARIKIHLAFQEKNNALLHAISVAEKANLAKSEFISSMTHELRSPLNAIIGFAQLMETETPPPSLSQKESVTHILKAGWHLLKLINEILDLAKIEHRQISLSEEIISISEILHECHPIIEQQALQHNVKLNFPVFTHSIFVYADRTRLKQILINLLTNAIKYNSQPGSVTVNCSKQPSGRLRISITDTGLGLTPEQLVHLFEPFNRLGQENGAEEGTGIGLVVSKRMIELMGGKIGVESNVGTGSVFWFELNSVTTSSITINDHCVVKTMDEHLIT